jgi:hypothetical protein
MKAAAAAAAGMEPRMRREERGTANIGSEDGSSNQSFPVGDRIAKMK